MHIVPDQENYKLIYFLFYEAFGDYNFIGREQARRHDFDGAMVVNDLRQW